MVNYNITVIWNISSITIDRIKAYDKAKLAQKLDSRLKRAIGFSKTACYPCGSLARINGDNIVETTTIQYRLIASTDEECLFEDLYKSIISVLGQELKISIDNSSYLVIRATLDARLQEVIEDMSVSVLGYFWTEFCLVSYYIINEKYCPEIQVKYSDIKSLGNTSIMVKRLNNDNIHDDELVNVCLDDYVLDMSRVNAPVTANGFAYLHPYVAVVTCSAVWNIICSHYAYTVIQ